MTRRASARRYARALFDVARTEGQDFERIGEELAGVAALAVEHEELARVFGTPAVPAAQKRAILEQLLARSPVTPVLHRMLRLLADRDRLVLLPELADAYHSRLLDHQNVVRAEVTTAMPLPPGPASALQRELAQLTGRDVRLDVRVDPSIVGGAVARIGSTVYDASVTTQLERIRQRLTGAAV